MIRLSRAHRDLLRVEAERAYPQECCGILVGREEDGVHLVEDVVPSINLSDTPQKTFEVDMALRLRLHKELRDTGLGVIGHYHSHPEGQAEPSARDRERAWEEDMVWLIVAVKSGEAVDVGAHLFKDAADGFSPMVVKPSFWLRAIFRLIAGRVRAYLVALRSLRLVA